MTTNKAKAFTDQKDLLAAEADSTSETQIQEAIEHGRNTAGRDGIDRVMSEYGVDLLIGPGDSDLYTYAACAGELSSALHDSLQTLMSVQDIPSGPFLFRPSHIVTQTVDLRA